ncbi:related to Structural maintenance of chromosomes protein 1 [Hanseniaspora guilliermondii]|uniref:Structural maintenance of chromosomes protein n=1 Tax=Hanseniaspora guilliermondii TaxID=56406 RepID=A0A1L0CGX0_9ASCO|nr:related to Structural maintenance of chromosomes protein 1 [Hanseniaspora guilliermondii]
MGRLLNLKLSNFKSYKDDVNIDIGSSNFISIIGPNGSGKSNIMDAISFVLGVDTNFLRSSSITQLIYRGKKTNENVENNDDSHLSVTRASVEAIYQKNDDSIVKFYRDVDLDGASRYKINGKIHSLQKYIHALNSENILVEVRNFLVFQGDVEQVASKDPFDLTNFFERISGSIKFKKEYDQIKQEYLRTANECGDAIIEKKRLQTEISHYTESANKNDKYNEKLDEKQKLTIQLQLFQLYLIDDQLNAVDEEIDNIQTDIGMVEDSLKAKEESYDIALNENVKYQFALKNNNKNIKEFLAASKKLKATTLNKTQNESKSYESTISELNHNLDILKVDLENHNDMIANLKETKDSLEKSCKHIKAEIDVIENDQAKFNNIDSNVLSQINNIKSDYISLKGGDILDKEIQLKGNKLDELRINLRKVNKQIDAYENLIKEQQTEKLQKEKTILKAEDTLQSKDHDVHTLEKQKKKVIANNESLKKKINFDNIKLKNTLLKIDELSADQRETKFEVKQRDMLRSLKNIYPGVNGFVIDLFRPSSSKYNTAVSLLIGRNLYSIVVDTATTANACIQYMKAQRLGIATFLPLDVVSGKNPDFALNDKKAVFASEGLTYSRELNSVLRYICSDTIFSDDLKTAQKLRWNDNINAKIITLNGDVIQKSGIMTGGSTQASGNESRWNKIEYQTFVSTKDKLIDHLKKCHDSIGSNDMLIKDLENQLSEIEKDHNDIKLNISFNKSEVKDISKQIEYNQEKLSNDLHSEKSELERSIAMVQEDFDKLTEKKNSLLESMFSDLSGRLGFSVFEYENTTGNLLKEKNKQLDILSRDLSEVITKMTFEDRKKKSILNSIFNIEKAISDNVKVVEDIQKMMDNIDKEINGLTEKSELTAKEVEDIKTKFEENKLLVSNLSSEIDEIKDRRDKLKAELSEKESIYDSYEKDRVQLLKNCKMNAIEIPLINGSLNMDANADDNDFDYSIVVLDYDQLDKKLFKLKNKKLSNVEIHNNIKNKLADVEKELLTLQPNVHAKDRLKDLKGKYNKYNNEVVHDLKEKEKKLLDKFKKVKNQRRQSFEETLNYVMENIDSVYKELTVDPSISGDSTSSNGLMGGSASINLEFNEEDEDEPYLAALKYQATPPMKKFKEIEYLSGGEKTVAALALLFTINKFKPSPFFVLDEIDAALDATNVIRVGNYIKKHANKDLQFIVISLKNSIFEESDALVGVYRNQKQNSSNVLTLDLSVYEP